MIRYQAQFDDVLTANTFTLGQIRSWADTTKGELVALHQIGGDTYRGQELAELIAL